MEALFIVGRGGVLFYLGKNSYLEHFDYGEKRAQLQVWNGKHETMKTKLLSMILSKVVINVDCSASLGDERTFFNCLEPVKT